MSSRNPDAGSTPNDPSLIPPTLDDVRAARETIAPHLPRTPLVHSWKLSERLACDFRIKCENLQPVGAFKVRGGVNLVANLSGEERARGVVGSSTGNHGQSLAFAGRLFGVRVVIYVPAENANPLKVKVMESLGAEVRRHGRDFDEAREECERAAAKEGLRYVHSANEPLHVAGVGTVALEVLEDWPDADVLIVPVGGGSGIAGDAVVVRALRPEMELIGVQSEEAPGAWAAWKEGHLEAHPRMESEHEGLATRVPFALPMGIMREAVSDFVLVPDAEINEAVRILARDAKLVAEGAGASPLAAALRMGDRLQGKKVVMVLSGGNLPLDRMSRVLGEGAPQPS
jgi:threonine dehydratase